MVKIHIDIIVDFNDLFIVKLVALCEKYQIYLLEDRKFADISYIFKKQFTTGIYKIQSWCHLITMHALVGSGPILTFKDCANLQKQGILLIGEMSHQGNLLDDKYLENTNRLAQKHQDCVTGFICQKKISDDKFLYLTPGVNRNASNDSYDQKYKTPEKAIRDGADIIIVGRGITMSNNIKKECQMYKELAWQEYYQLDNINYYQ